MGKISRRDFVSISAAGGLVFLGPRPAHATPAGNRITIDAKPNPIVIDSTRTAVIVVDMQNDFGAEGGMFHRAGVDISLIRGTVAPTARVLTAARKAGIKVLYLKMAFQPDLSDADPADSPTRRNHRRLNVGKIMRAPNGTEGRILIRDTWNTDILPELTPKPEDITLYKHRYSGFFETDLDSILKRMGVTFLIVTGCTTSVCVESTIRDAMFRDHSCILLADCSAEVVGHGLARTNHEASLLTVETRLGWVSNSDEFVAALHAARQKESSC